MEVKPQGAGRDVTFLEKAFRGRRVVVTGHTGFKGAWLALWLQELGALVTGISLPANPLSLFRSLSLESRLGRHCEKDIRRLKDVEGVFASVEPEIVFHLAAQSLVHDSYSDPKTTFDTNVGGTVNVLECVRASTSVRAVVMVTSDKCYENQEWEYAYRENDPLGGHDPYSASKGAAEIAISSYRRSFFAGAVSARPVGVASVRAGNVIGGGDWGRNRILPDCVRALAAGEPVRIRNPRAVRPWQHVLEPLSGYLLLGKLLLEQPERYASAFNFGPPGNEHVSVGELVGMFLKSWGGGEVEMGHDQNAPHEAMLLRLSCDKARASLGWSPRLPIGAAVEWTAEWYREWHASEHRGDGSQEQLLALSRGQLQRYMRL